MKIDGLLDRDEVSLLESLVGQRFVSYGSAKVIPGSSVAVEEIYLETEETLLSLGLQFESTDVCGELSDYLHLHVSEGYSNRSAADEYGGSFFHFRGETISQVKILHTRLERIRPGSPQSEYLDDSGVLLEFDSGKLAVVRVDLSIPEFEFQRFSRGESIDLPDPAAGWPADVFDQWQGNYQ